MSKGTRTIEMAAPQEKAFLVAVDKRTGKQVWKTERPAHRRGFATPYLWRHDGTEELIVNGSLKVSSYEPRTGALRWTSRGMARVANASPTDTFCPITHVVAKMPGRSANT